MLVWGIFIAVVIVFLAVDLGVFNREAHVISTREASIWTAVWVTIALSFSGVIYLLYSNGLVANPTEIAPTEAVIKYVTGYLVELSLSVDNIFVIAVIFASFKIPQKYQHRVLFWGILGAIIFRALMILFGVVLINRFSWTTYIFGAFLLYTAFRMLVSSDDEEGFQNAGFFKYVRKIFPITKTIEGEQFFVRKRHILAGTPLFLALLVIEGTDILFALDSIPAVLAITTDPFLVFSSNILAILGLRSMYFFLANMLQKFHYIKYSLVVILGYVGVKLVFVQHIHFPEWLSLAIIGLALAGGILYSLFFTDDEPPLEDAIIEASDEATLKAEIEKETELTEK
ncbi:MAG: TerC family protein [Bacteroidia bacterium]